MFADKIEILVKAGKGGDGRTSFLHEKYRAKGGPDGGDGGKGGDVVFEVDHNINTLAYFRKSKRITSEDGEMGKRNKSHGKSAGDVIIKVPLGTMVFLEDTKIADLTTDGGTQVIAKGGHGGFGNAHFVSSTRQAPRTAELGEPGEQFNLRLELKLVADVGLVGLPNAGKSTLLSVISNARPEIADYAFTTLVPNLGVVEGDGYNFVAADIPGLIKGASRGKGLGDEFLRHVERTAVLLHLVDASSADVIKDWRTIQSELAAYGQDLSAKPQIVVLTKIDGTSDADVKKLISRLKKLTKDPVMAISAVAHRGLKELLGITATAVEKARKTAAEKLEEPFVYNLENVEVAKEAWQIKQTEDGWYLSGARIEHFARRTDFNQTAGLERLRDIMAKMGISRKLEQRGIMPGDKVEVAGKHLTW